MEGWRTDCQEGYITKKVQTPYGAVTVHRPVLDEKTRDQRRHEVESALAHLAKETQI